VAEHDGASSPHERGSRERRRRRALFDRGANAFARLHPEILASEWPNDTRAKYVCPLCLKVFVPAALEHPRGLTLEHAPPRALGGRVLALTCWSCNNHGSRLDVEMQKAERPVDILRQEHAGEHFVRFRINDGPSLVFRLSVHDGAFRLFGHVGADAPTDRDAFLAEMTRMHAEGYRSSDRFHMDFFRDRHDPRLARAGYLRAAYLVAFAQFGYRYILNAALDPVRLQIRRPKDEIIPAATFGVAPTAPKTTKHLIVAREPAALRGIVVQLGRRIVLLPPPNDRSFYDRVNAHRSRPDGALTINGDECEWPKTAMHQGDIATE
jgi:hypothetical protein